MSRIYIIKWDYRQQPDLDALDREVYHLSVSGHAVRIHQIDTGSDEYAIAICAEETSPEDVQEAWERFEATGVAW